MLRVAILPITVTQWVKTVMPIKLSPAVYSIDAQYRQFAFGGLCLMGIGLVYLFGMLVLAPLNTTGLNPAFIVVLAGAATALLSTGLPVFFLNLRLRAQGLPSTSLSREGTKSRSRGYHFNQALALTYAAVGIGLAVLALNLLFI